MQPEPPDSLWLYRSRVGYSALVKVGDFSLRYRLLRNKLEPEGFDDFSEFDINVDEVKVQTPAQIIEHVINNPGSYRAASLAVNDAVSGNLSNSSSVSSSSTYYQLENGHTSSSNETPSSGQVELVDPNNGISIAPDIVRSEHAQQLINVELSSHVRAVESRKANQHSKRKVYENIPKFAELVAPLQTLKRKQKSIVNHDATMLNKLTEESLNFEINARTKGKHASIDPNEVVLRVAVFHPKNGTKSQEFLVLGSQSLAELADRIYCVQSCTQDAELIPGSCFFIEDGAYDDTRSHRLHIGRSRVNPADIANLSLDSSQLIEEEAGPIMEARVVRYSKPVIKWCSKEAVEHDKLTSFSMEESTFNDLMLRLGSYYSFCHHGNCSHTIIFTEMRIFNANDHTNKLAYPLRCFESRIRRQKCRVCDLLPATAVTFGDKLSSEEPCFFCDECYQLLHYSAVPPNTLIYDDFEVFPYIHD